MVRVLQVFGEPISFGGQEAFVMNIYKTIDKNKVQFDFFTPFYCDNENMKETIEKMGGHVYISGKEFETSKRKMYFINELKKILKKCKYDIVHINSGSTFVLAYGSKIAKKNNVKKVIAHSHSTGIVNFKYKIIKFLSKNKFKKYTDVYLACSDDAAKWKFPKDVINSKKYIVIKNGIQVDKFIFNNDIRNEIRKKLEINDHDFVIGHVGRFCFEKNHEFIIDIIKTLVEKNPKIKLVLVGKGDTEAYIKEKVKKYKLDNNVTFVGVREDINMMYQAFDIFILPSLHEGLPIVGIEAQTSGLKCLFSDKVPKAIDITGNCKFIPLEKDLWVKEIEELKSEYRRENMEIKVREANFDIKCVISEIEKIYLK